MKTLVTFFSAEGNTRRVAQEIGMRLMADLYEIRPEVLYTAADINWKNPLARCNKEWIGKKDVPVVGRVQGFEEYDAVFIGFPIWYGIAPNVVNTFCKGYDWSGKKVYLYATSGGSGMGKTASKLQPYMPGAEIVSERLLKGSEDMQGWLRECGLLEG